MPETETATMTTALADGAGPSLPVVYVDAATMLVRSGDTREASRVLLPGAAEALAHLRDAGHPVELVGNPVSVGAVLGVLRDAAPVARAGLAQEAEGWVVTDDAAVCAAARNPGRRRTILVGPTTPGLGLAHRASDVQARGLLEAVLVILASEAMPGAARA